MSDLKEVIEELRRLDAEATPGPWEAFLYQADLEGLQEEDRADVVAQPDDPDKRCTIRSLSTLAGNMPVRMARDAELIAAMRNALPALLDRIAELEGRKAWRPIESAPKDEHTVVLMSDGDGTWVAELLGVYPYDTDKMHWWPRTDKQFSRMSGFDRSVFRVKQRDFTHWMPLPPPPTEDGGVRDEK